MFLRIAEKVFVFVSLLFFTDAILPSLSEQGVTGASLIQKLISYGSQLGIILLIVVWYKKVARIVIKEKLLWFLVGLAVLSVCWSAAPSSTLRNITVLLRGTMFGVYLAARYSLKEQLRLFAWPLGIGALLSIVFALVLPSYGVMGMGSVVDQQSMAHMGAWRGVYIHKNPLGRITILSALVFFLIGKSSRSYRWLAWAGFVLSILLIVKSTSKTALLILAIVLGILPLYRALRWNYTIALPFSIAVILMGGGVAIFLASDAENILSVFGRDLTFSGRAELWSAVLDNIWQRPWLGYGYAGFWLGWESESTDVLSALNWIPPHSHNGFLEIGLDLGVLGVAAFLLSFIPVCLRAVTWVRLSKTAESLWPLVFLTFFFLANLTENSLMRNNFLWILYVAVAFSMHNKRDNLAESNSFSQQTVNGKAIKQMAPTAPRSRI